MNIVCINLCLASFTWHYVFEIRYIIVNPCDYTIYYISVWICHNFMVHVTVAVPVSGELHSFHFGTILIVLLWSFVYVFCQTYAYIYLGHLLKTVIVGLGYARPKCMVVFGKYYQFLKVIVSIYTPNISAWMFWLFHSLTNPQHIFVFFHFDHYFEYVALSY